MKKIIQIEVPEEISKKIDKKIAELIFELGLAELKGDIHKKAEILAYFEAKGWKFY